jgi:pimeloyl-ACP methyl ester carboxylesterase
VTTVTLTTADGVRLAARWLLPPGIGEIRGDTAGDGTAGARDGVAVVVVHGFCSSQDEAAVKLVALQQATAGRRVLTVDLRGHGSSGGTSTLGFLERLDVDSAVRAARADADVVVVVGESMGGVASIEHLAALSTSNPDGADGGVIVGTPARWQVPRSARGVMAVMLTQTAPGRALTARRLGARVAARPDRGAEPRVRIAAVRRPVAVVHGLADRFVSPLAARTLHAAAAEPRLLDLVPGMGHGFCTEAVGPVDAAVGWVVAQVGAGVSAAPSPGENG